MNDVFTHELMDGFGDQIAGQVAHREQLNPDQVRQALQSLSPVVLGSLKRKKAELDDDSLEAMLQRAGASEDRLDNLDNAFDNIPTDDDLDPVIDRQTREQTSSALSQKLGISGGAASRLLPMLVPVILGMLMKKGRQQGGASTQRSGGISSILDRDGDGSVLDDIAGMVLGGGGRGQRRGGFFSWILSLFLGRR